VSGDDFLAQIDERLAAFRHEERSQHRPGRHRGDEWLGDRSNLRFDDVPRLFGGPFAKSDVAFLSNQSRSIVCEIEEPSLDLPPGWRWSGWGASDRRLGSRTVAFT
jgi:hypothetical protein